MSDQIYTPESALKVVRNYKCSLCWGHLLHKPSDDDACMEVVYCPECGDNAGLVHGKYVERKVQQSAGERLDASYNLRGLLPCLPAHTKQEIMKSLGY